MKDRQTVRLVAWFRTNVVGGRPAVIPIVLSAVMLAAAFAAGIASRVAGTASDLPSSLLGFTAVLSSRVYGLAGQPYNGYATVQEALERAGMDPAKIAHNEYPLSTFRDPAKLNSMLRTASTVDTCGSDLVLNPNNDQGIVDYIRGAFTLFGMNVFALYHFYFIILAISIVLYILSFWRDYRACVVLFGCVCAVYTFMPSWIYGDNGLISLANQRFLSILGIIPVIHVLLLIAQRSATFRWLDITTAISQSALVAFAYAIRSSAKWMYLAVASLTVFYLVRPVVIAARHRLSPLSDTVSVRRAALSALFVATILAIGAFRSLYLTSPCGEALNAHPVWHTIYYSLQFGPRWGAKLPPFNGLGHHADWANPVPYVDNATKTGDEMVYAAVKDYVIRHHLRYQTNPDIFGATPASRHNEAVPLGSWVTYDAVVRDMFFEFARKHPRYVVENFLIVKPKLFFVTIRKYFSVIWTDLSLTHLGIFALMVLTIAVAWPVKGERKPIARAVGTLTAILLLCFAWASVPAFIFYTGEPYIGDEATLAIAVIVLWIAYLTAAGAAFVKRTDLLSIARRSIPR